MLLYSVGAVGCWLVSSGITDLSLLLYMCAKVFIIVASQQLHPSVVVVRNCIVCAVVSVNGYSIRREIYFLAFELEN